MWMSHLNAYAVLANGNVRSGAYWLDEHQLVTLGSDDGHPINPSNKAQFEGTEGTPSGPQGLLPLAQHFVTHLRIRKRVGPKQS